MKSSLVRVGRKIGGILNNARLFPKYMISHGAVVLFTALIIAAVSFKIARDEIGAYARASTLTILEQSGRLLERKNSELQINLVAQLESADVYRLLRQSMAEKNSLDRFRLERQLTVMMATNRWIRSILLAPQGTEPLFLAGDGPDTDLSEIRDYDPSEVESLHGKPYWYISADGSVFFCKVIYDLQTTASLGILAVGVDNSFFDSLSSLESSRGLGAFFVVSDSSRQIIYHTKTSPEALDRVREWIEKDQSVPERFTDQKRSYLASHEISAAQSWLIINIIPEKELSALSAGAGVLILETALIGLLAALVFAFFLVRTEVGKITTLVAQTHLIAKGNFRIDRGFRSRDELGELASEISSMARNIGELVERVAFEKNQKTEAELKALRFEYSTLQSMINPHFIANTLELVNSTAKIRGVPEIGEVVCLLGDLLRESIRRKNNLVRLEEELDFCRTYLKIQELLRESPLEIRYDVPDILLDMLVPSLILQPIVENAILHGIEPKIGPASIRIAAKADGTSLEISITDDGVGMSEERLFALRSPQESEPLRKIGLESVSKRIQILFGPSYGTTIRSSAGTGTSVAIRMPAARA